MKKTKYIILLSLLGLYVCLGPTVVRSMVMFYHIEAAGMDDHIKSVRENEAYVALGEVDETFLEALVAVEDKRFYSHKGYDPLAIARSAYLNLTHGHIVSGASTITQQVAKNLFLTFDQTLERKLTELYISQYLEAAYTKDEILEIYINIIYYGEHQYGISNASHHYFNKTAKALEEHESVLLAGIPRWPSGYALNSHYEKAAKRSQRVLEAMVDENYINAQEYKTITYEIQKGARDVVYIKGM